MNLKIKFSCNLERLPEQYFANTNYWQFFVSN